MKASRQTPLAEADITQHRSLPKCRGKDPNSAMLPILYVRTSDALVIDEVESTECYGGAVNWRCEGSAASAENLAPDIDVGIRIGSI